MTPAVISFFRKLQGRSYLCNLDIGIRVGLDEGLGYLSVKEAAGGARTVRSNTGRGNALYCRVNVLVNDGSDETRLL